VTGVTVYVLRILYGCLFNNMLLAADTVSCKMERSQKTVQIGNVILTQYF